MIRLMFRCFVYAVAEARRSAVAHYLLRASMLIRAAATDICFFFFFTLFAPRRAISPLSYARVTMALRNEALRRASDIDAPQVDAAAIFALSVYTSYRRYAHIFT